MKTLHISVFTFFLIFLVSDNPVLQYANADYPPPLQQVLHGIPLSQIKCNEGFVNIFKKAGGSPACVKLATAVNLVDRGTWLTNVQTAWFSYQSVTTPWLENIPSDILTNHTEQCAMANSTWGYFKNHGITPFEILWTYPNLVATPEGVVGQQPTIGFLVHVLPNESSIVNKLGFKEKFDVYYPLVLSLTPRLSICNDSSRITSVSANVINSNFTINYNIIGGQISEIRLDKKQSTLELSLVTFGNGTLTVSIPRTLLDPKNAYDNQDAQFIVLIVGKKSGILK